MKLGIINPAEAIAIKTSTYNLTAVDSGNVYTNEGASSAVNFYLPTPIVGLVYTFIVQDADGIFINADATSTIVVGAYSTTSLSSSNPGDAIVLTAISTTKWIATKKIGTFQGLGVGNAYFSTGAGTVINKLTGDTTCSAVAATFSVNRYGCAGAALLSSAYFAGGRSGAGSGTLYSSIDKLISDSSCFGITATLSAARFAIASAVISSSAYFAGGSVSNTIDKLTNDTTCAAVAATLTSSDYWLASAVISSSAYFAGELTPGTKIQKLTNDTTCANVAATLSGVRTTAVGTVISSSMYVVGGSNASVPVNIIDKITNDTTCAVIAATLSLARVSSGAARISSSAYIAAGVGGSAYNTIDKLTNDTTCAAVTATLSTSTYGVAGLTINF